MLWGLARRENTGVGEAFRCEAGPAECLCAGASTAEAGYNYAFSVRVAGSSVFSLVAERHRDQVVHGQLVRSSLPTSQLYDRYENAQGWVGTTILSRL